MCLVLTLEAADVAVVCRDEEGRLRRPLVLIISAKEQSGTREIRPERFGGRGREEEGRGALGSPLVSRRSPETFGSGSRSSMLRRRSRKAPGLGFSEVGEGSRGGIARRCERGEGRSRWSESNY